MNFKMIDSDWTNDLKDLFESILTDFKTNDKFNIYSALLKIGKTTEFLKSENIFASYLRKCLLERIFEIESLTREQQ